MTAAGFDSRVGRVVRDLVRGVPPQARWFALREFREVIGPRASEMMRADPAKTDLVKEALVCVLVPAARREAQQRSQRGPLRDHPDLEEILLTRVWQAVWRWDGVRVEGLCALLAAQSKFAALDAARAAAEASRRTRLAGGRFQALEERLVQTLGRQLTLAEKYEAARTVLPAGTRGERVDEVVTPVRHVEPPDDTLVDPGPGPEATVLARFTASTVRAWLDDVPDEAAALYRRWLDRGRGDDPPGYALRPLLPHVGSLLAALGDEPLVDT